MSYANHGEGATGASEGVSGAARASGQIAGRTYGCPRFLSLMSGEEIVYVTHPAAWNFLGLILIGILLLPVLLIGLFVFLYILIQLKCTVYVVTTKRVVAKGGFISTWRKEVRLSDIRAVQLSNSIWQRIVGLGTIMIGTAATDKAELSIVGVKQSQQVVNMINELR